jgi:hypothetical protein
MRADAHMSAYAYRHVHTYEGVQEMKLFFSTEKKENTVFLQSCESGKKFFVKRLCKEKAKQLKKLVQEHIDMGLMERKMIMRRKEKAINRIME